MRRRNQLAMNGARVMISAAAMTLAAVNHAGAHSVSVSRGTVVVGPSRIVADISIPIDDLLHAFRPAFDDQERLSGDVLDECVSRYGLQVLEHLVIRDLAGERLSGRVSSAAHDLSVARAYEYESLRSGRAKYRLEYDISHPPTYLTFQQTFFSDGPAHAAQLVLDVRVQPDEPGCIVQLTNRGNAETVQVHWDDTGTTALRIEAPNRFRIVTGRLDVEPGKVWLNVAMPLSLLETWSPVSRSDPDFVTSAEWSAAKKQLTRLFETGATLQIDGQPVSAIVSSIDLLEPDHEIGQRRPAPNKWPAWAARVGATLEFATDHAPRDVLLEWRLFNSAVLEAVVTCTDDDRATAHRLTPYEATLRWAARTPGNGGG